MSDTEQFNSTITAQSGDRRSDETQQDQIHQIDDGLEHNQERETEGNLSVDEGHIDPVIVEQRLQHYAIRIQLLKQIHINIELYGLNF